MIKSLKLHVFFIRNIEFLSNYEDFNLDKQRGRYTVD